MKIFKQIPLIMSEVGAIEKSRQGSGINYKFRGIDDIYFALQPLLAKHGVFFAPNVIDQQRHERESKNGGVLTYTILKVEFTFYADDGSSFKVCTVGEAMDTSDKSSNKAMSAALKYAILELFCIPTEEEKDTEYQNHEPKPRGASVKAPGSNEMPDRYQGVGGKESRAVTEPQLKRLYAIVKQSGLTDSKVKEMVQSFGVKDSKQLNQKQYDELCSTIESYGKPSSGSGDIF